MRLFLQLISLCVLLGMVASSIMFARGELSLDQTKSVTTALTVGWFVITPFWMGRENEQVQT